MEQLSQEQMSYISFRMQDYRERVRVTERRTSDCARRDVSTNYWPVITLSFRTLSSRMSLPITACLWSIDEPHPPSSTSPPPPPPDSWDPHCQYEESWGQTYAIWRYQLDNAVNNVDLFCAIRVRIVRVTPWIGSHPFLKILFSSCIYEWQSLHAHHIDQNRLGAKTK